MEHTLLNGDVIEQLRSLPDKSFKCIVTSPPYNIGKNYGTAVNDKKPASEYLEWMRDVFTECARVLTDDGSLFINVGYTSAMPWIAMDVANVVRPFMTLQNQMTWVKNISVGETSHGQFKPVNSPRYVSITNEMLFHFTKKGTVPIHRLDIGVPFMHKSNLKSRGVEKKEKPDKRCRGNSWFVPYETIQNNQKERGGHPASYPTELAEMCIKLACGSEKDCTVLDPFLGTGTTLVAAKKLGLSGTGIDINTDFLEYARSRLESTPVPGLLGSP
jgi:site-specific DNA-methyltransferase (adenine-specific)